MKQSIKNNTYLFHTFMLLSHYCGSYPYITKTVVKGKVFYQVAFVTRSLFCFQNLYNEFYNPIKKVPENIYNILTIQGLAHWICGDGTNIKGGGIILQTDSFTTIDVVRLISVLIYKFNCKCTLRYQRNNPVIYISKHSVRKLTVSLLPHIPKEIMYKILDNGHVKLLKIVERGKLEKTPLPRKRMNKGSSSN